MSAYLPVFLAIYTAVSALLHELTYLLPHGAV